MGCDRWKLQFPGPGDQANGTGIIRGGPWVHLVQSHGVLGHMMAYVTLLSVQSYATIRWAEWVI